MLASLIIHCFWLQQMTWPMAVALKISLGVVNLEGIFIALHPELVLYTRLTPLSCQLGVKTKLPVLE